MASEAREQSRQQDREGIAGADLTPWRQAVNASGEVVFMTDRDGVITFVNPEFVRLYGYTAEEVVGRSTPRILKSGRTPDEAYDLFWRRLIGGEVVRGELINRTKAGELVEVEFSANPVRDGQNAIVGFLAIERDVTARKQLETQFFQAQKMEAVGRLAGGVAHDFNNLLTSILGYSELLMDSLAPDDRRRGDLEEIRRAGQSAATLTRQLLTFSRRQVVEPTIVDMNAVVDQFNKILGRTVGEDVVVTLRLEPALNRIRMDTGQLEQILMNLSVNARDAMPRGGTLTIETSNIDIRKQGHGAQSRIPPGRYVALAITDTGTGMSQEVQSHLFEPFFTTKEFGKGTGLGLSTVFGIVKQHDGCIIVDSTVHRGTTLTIYFPEVERHVPLEIRENTADSHPTGNETILIAEDNDGLRTLVAKTLTNFGYHTIAARDAREAMQLSSEFDGPIHLLVTDVVMPGPDGPELSRELTRDRTETRVLYMSGYTDGMISDHGLEDRGGQFLQKPFSRDALARKVRQVLEAPQARSDDQPR